MRILLTGASGFIGRHLVPCLIERGHQIIAVARDKEKASELPWYSDVDFHFLDIHAQRGGRGHYAEFNNPDALIHLAWPGLPNYKELFHFEESLARDYKFIKTLVEQGITQVLVTGTCFEYGMQNGCLDEGKDTFPSSPYALAKDTLRKFLQSLQLKESFSLQWVRLFYMYGAGQNSNSILAQLDSAIENGDQYFNMSGGEQLRDYLPVEEVAKRITAIIECDKMEGIYNCSSGVPISIRRLVENRIKERKSSIKLNLGYYPYPDYEPMAFWGDDSKFNKEISESGVKYE
ncbi:MAG: NAD(P)-dependent oxidoreductase [Gammaproteobacteria bacterium]|nr:NAD(P)-dependent oxidoreductase [Gammaproteobacteria bacterium]